MKAQRLVHLANQIGAFFAAEPERGVAMEGVANHIKRFWDPRMRREIIALLDQGALEELQPLVADALRAHRDRLLGQKVTP